MSIVKNYITVLSLVLSASAKSSVEPQTYVEILDFTEEYSTDVDVSGGLLVGYQVESLTPHSTGDTLYFSVPDDINDIYMDISSIDGIYSANLVLKVVNSGTRWTKLTIPSQYIKQLQNYSPEELVSLVYVEVPTKGKKKRKQIFPSSWGKPLQRQIFYISTTSSFPTWSSKNQSGDKITGRCHRVDSAIHTAFNFACVIDGDIEKGKATPVTFKAGRRQTHVVWTVE